MPELRLAFTCPVKHGALAASCWRAEAFVGAAAGGAGSFAGGAADGVRVGGSAGATVDCAGGVAVGGSAGATVACAGGVAVGGSGVAGTGATAVALGGTCVAGALVDVRAPSVAVGLAAAIVVVGEAITTAGAAGSHASPSTAIHRTVAPLNK
jgi:type IV secretion system protein TrbL